MLERFFRNFDFLILSFSLAISAFGIMILWSIRPDLVDQQIVFLFLGFALFFLFSKIDYRIFFHFRWLIYIFICIALFITLLIAPQTRGVTRWLEVGGLRIQSSEILKPFLILAFSGVLSLFPSVGLKRLSLLLGLVALPLLLIFKQPDLGNTIVFLLIFISLLIVGGLKWPLAIGGVFLTMAIVPILSHFLKSYQRERIISFLNPQSDPLGSGYHLIQAMVTVGSGEIFGRGLGMGTQAQLRFLPEQHTDFIFATIAEELGFLGALILIVLYVLLLWRIINVAKDSNDQFGTLILAGVFTMLLSQFFINVGMNTGLLPITGITLPLVSYGGGSIISTMISLGIVESVSRGKRQGGSLEIR